MRTEMLKRVLEDVNGNAVAPVTMASAVMMGDGTTMDLKTYLTVMLSDQKPSTDNSSVFATKKALWLGDSIGVSGDPTYPATVCDSLEMFLTNKCSSGGNSARMRNIVQGLGSNTAPDLSVIDYVFIMIGHNCASELTGSTIDNISGDDYTAFPDTFHGNVGSVIEYIWAQNSAIQIYLITPIQSGGGFMSAIKKARPALVELGEAYSIPVIDAYGESGICIKNVAAYTSDLTHPNAAGVERLAGYIVAWLKNH